MGEPLQNLQQLGATDPGQFERFRAELERLLDEQDYAAFARAVELSDE